MYHVNIYPSLVIMLQNCTGVNCITAANATANVGHIWVRGQYRLVHTFITLVLRQCSFISYDWFSKPFFISHRQNILLLFGNRLLGLFWCFYFFSGCFVHTVMKNHCLFNTVFLSRLNRYFKMFKMHRFLSYQVIYRLYADSLMLTFVTIYKRPILRYPVAINF